jgi:TetR/AcrR family transcriptional regulator, cholesterol catabolism regulator
MCPAVKSERTRKRILESAALELRSSGYSGMRLVEVARRASMKTGSLYYHFESREALVQAVLAEGMSRTHKHVVDRLRAEPSANPIDRLTVAITAHVELLHQLGDFASASTRTIGQLPAELRVEHDVAEAAYAKLWDDLLHGALKAGLIRDDVQVEITRRLVLGVLNSTAEWTDGVLVESPDLAHAVVDLVIGGIAARRRDSVVNG